MDPIHDKLPAYSPYNFAANRPIDGIDFGGLSWIPVVDKRGNVTGFKWTDAAPDPTNNIFALAIHVRDLGTYNSGSKYNLGSAVITAYGENQEDIFTFDGTSLPSDIQNYATIEDGLHTAELGFHKQSEPDRYLAIRINNNQISPVKNDFNPSNGKSFATGINLHKAGLGNKTGLTNSGDPISAGCILCDRNTFDNLIDVFDNTTERGVARSRIISARIFVHESLKRLGLPSVLTTGINPATFSTKNSNGKLETVSSPLPNPTIGFGINRSSDLPLPNVGSGAFDQYSFPTRSQSTEDENDGG